MLSFLSSSVRRICWMKRIENLWTPHPHVTLFVSSKRVSTLLKSKTSNETILKRRLFIHALNDAKQGLSQVGSRYVRFAYFLRPCVRERQLLSKEQGRICRETAIIQKQRSFVSYVGPDQGQGLIVQEGSTTVEFKVPGPFRNRLTTYYVVETLNSQNDADMALRFFEWAGQQTGYKHSSTSYRALVEVLGVTRRFDALKQVRMDMERMGCRMTPVLLGTLARTYCKGEMYEEALECAQHMEHLGRSPGLSFYAELFCNFVEADCPDQAYLMFKRMLALGSRPDSCTFNKLLNALRKAGKLELMDKVVEDMREQLCAPTVVTLGILVDGLCKAGRLEEAFTLFTKNKGMANVVVYNNMLHGLGKIGRIEEALELFKEMKQKGFLPQVYTFNILIQGLGLVNKVDEALCIFEVMTSEGFLPDLFTYNLMIKVLINVSRLDEAYRLFEEMPARQCMPDIVTYSTLMHGAGETGDVNGARKLFRRIQDTGRKPNVVAFGTLITALCKGGKLREGIMLFKEMKSVGCVPDEFVCTTLSASMFKAGRFQEAQNLFEGMVIKDSRTYLIASNAAIDGFGKSGEIEKAWSLFQEMLNSGPQPDVVTYNTLIAHLGKSGNVGIAWKLFHDMPASNCSPDVVSYSTLIDILCKQGRIWQALRLFEGMDVKGIYPNVRTYRSLICELCKVGRFQKAYFLYKEMIKKGCILNDITYRSLIEGFSNSCEYVDECYNLFKQMIEKGYSSSSKTSFLLRRSLKKAGKLDEALLVKSKSAFPRIRSRR